MCNDVVISGFKCHINVSDTELSVGFSNVGAIGPKFFLCKIEMPLCMHVSRQTMKELFNARFGSLFRTHHNPTYFTRRLSRFADVYTSSLVNFLKYPLNYTFYPQRTALPHELLSSDHDITLP